MRIASHRELVVWQKAMRLATMSYAIARALPEQERFELGQQIRRAAASIPANVAEGKGRRTRTEFARYLAIARGSAQELDTLIAVAHACGFVREHDAAEAGLLLVEVTNMLTAMLRRLAPL